MFQVHAVLSDGWRGSDSSMEHSPREERGIHTGKAPAHLPGGGRQGLPLQEGLRSSRSPDVQESLLSRLQANIMHSSQCLDCCCCDKSDEKYFYKSCCLPIENILHFDWTSTIPFCTNASVAGSVLKERTFKLRRRSSTSPYVCLCVVNLKFYSSTTLYIFHNHVSCLPMTAFNSIYSFWLLIFLTVFNRFGLLLTAFDIFWKLSERPCMQFYKVWPSSSQELCIACLICLPRQWLRMNPSPCSAQKKI